MENFPIGKKEKEVDRRHPLETLIVIGGFGVHPDDNIECYDLENDKWNMKFSLNTTRHSFRSIVFNDELMLIGGTEGINPTSTVEKYDFATEKLSPLPSLVENRNDCALAIVLPNLYAIGGHVPGKILSSGERYNNITKKWINISPMSTPRSKCAAVTLNGEIVVVGGFNDDALSSVEAYDPKTEIWRDCSPMHMNRAGVAAAALNNYLYVFGGSGDEQYHDSVEKYDASIDKWSFVHSSSIMRVFAEAVDFNETIVIAGGFSVANEPLSFVESYDPDKDSYNTMGSLATPRNGFNLVRVPWALIKKSMTLNAENQH